MGVPGQLETKGESPQVPSPWPQRAEGLSQQRCLALAGLRTDVTAPAGSRGRCCLPGSSICPPMTLCPTLVLKWTLTCSDFCRIQHFQLKKKCERQRIPFSPSWRHSWQMTKCFSPGGDFGPGQLHTGWFPWPGLPSSLES